MSLINEALQRARVEAARQEAAEAGVPPAALPIHVPARRRPWLAPLLGFAAGLALVVAVAAGLWLRGTGLRNPDAADPLAGSATDRPETAPPVGGATAPAAAAPQAPAGAIAGEEETAALATGAQAEPTRLALPPAAPAAARTPRARPPAPSTYLRRAEPPGGGRLKLDFIVWSQSHPFAQINGELISPGQRIDGYDLLTVERERVQLRGPKSTFWIRAR